MSPTGVGQDRPTSYVQNCTRKSIYTECIWGVYCQIFYKCCFADLHENLHLRGESMKKNVLVKTGERTETRIRTIPAQYNEMGELIADAYDETYTVTVPVMEPRNVEMTADEIAELEAMQANMPEPVPDPSDARMTEIEAALIELAAMIGGDT